MASVRAARQDQQDGYKLPKILSKCLAKRSADCAGEGEGCETGGFEGSGVAENLSVRRRNVSMRLLTSSSVSGKSDNRDAG